MYVLCRVLGLRRPAALLAGLAYMFSGSLITNATFPQIIGVVAWLPLLLVIAERVIQHAESSPPARRIGLVWLGGALVVGTQFLAGHPEISIYGLFSLGV